jgi:predicted heme/steroid binding protein
MSFSVEEVAKHNSKSSCWVILDDRVLDVTDFLKDHPGGELAILTFAGKDATEEFNMIHPPDVVDKYLDKKAVLGKVGGGGGGAAAPAAVAEAAPAPPAGDKGDAIANLQSWGDWREGISDNPGVLLIPVASFISAAYYMVVAILIEVCKTIFSIKNFKITNDRVGLTRSAMFLIVFQIIHAVGNLHVFLGPDDFNGYGYFYVRLYFTGLGLPANIVEEYVLLSALLHVFVAIKRTWDISLNYTVASGQLNLAITGVLLLTFMTIHLFQFRFGATEPYLVRPPTYFINFLGIPKLQLFWTSDTSVDPVPVRDIYKLEFELFKSVQWCAFYLFSVLMFMAHACLGWKKVVPAPALRVPKGHIQRVKNIGYVLILGVGAIYLSFPLYTHFTAMKVGSLGTQG